MKSFVRSGLPISQVVRQKIYSIAVQILSETGLWPKLALFIFPGGLAGWLV
jgi:hypothetical protein